MRVTSLLLTILLPGTSIAQQPAADSNVTFKSQAREVLLEVVVRDAHGKAVTKIDPSQVSVYEDGVRQDIKSFRLVPGREVRAEVEKQTAAAAVVPAGATAAAPVPAAPRPYPLRAVNVVCLILNDLSPESRGFAFKAARKFVSEEVRPDTFIGVFSLDASGLRPVFPFSNNREHLVKAVELAAVNQLPALSQSSASVLNGLSMTTFGLPFTAVANSTITVVPATAPGGIAQPPITIEGPPPVGVPINTDGSYQQDPLGVRGDLGVSVNAGLREIDALIRLVKLLSNLPFQKTVLLMSTGLTRPTEQLDYWQSLITQANRGGVTFYGMDVYGLGNCQDRTQCAEGTTSAQGGTGVIPGTPGSTPSSASGGLLQAAASLSQGQSTVAAPAKSTNPYASGGSSQSSPSTPAAQMMESMHQSDYVRSAVLSANTQEALREISESTGGFVIANTNNTEQLLTRVMEDVDTHYELAYRPASAANDGHYCKIEVKLAGADLRVQTRNGYYAVPDTGEGPLTAGDMGALEALNADPPPFDFGFESAAFRFRSTQGKAQYAIAFEVPIASLTATAEAKEKKHRYHAYLMALVKNEQGEIVERVSKDVPSEIADKALAAGLGSETMIYEHAVKLGPGHYTVETAVVDQESHRYSASVFPIDNRDEPGPGLSDIALLRRVHDLQRAPDPEDPFEIPGKRGQPFLSNTLPTGAQPYIYFVVYPEKGSAGTASLQVLLLKDGHVVATQKPALAQPDASGAVPMAIQPAAGPGEYEVKIAVEQEHHSVERTLKYTIAAN